jgi:hypothetical protein
LKLRRLWKWATSASSQAGAADMIHELNERLAMAVGGGDLELYEPAH